MPVQGFTQDVTLLPRGAEGVGVGELDAPPVRVDCFLCLRECSAPLVAVVLLEARGVAADPVVGTLPVALGDRDAARREVEVALHARSAIQISSWWRKERT